MSHEQLIKLVGWTSAVVVAELEKMTGEKVMSGLKGMFGLKVMSGLELMSGLRVMSELRVMSGPAWCLVQRDVWSNVMSGPT
jgi:hypothetical protein